MITVSKVVNSSQTELLCITYKILLDKLQYILDNISEVKNRKDKKDDNKPKVEEYINQSINIIKMLAGDLNFEYDISSELFNLYVYVQGTLIQNRTKEGIREAYTIIDKLYMAYTEVSENEQSSVPSISNAEQIYEGLTYGDNKLGRTYVQDVNRGYKV